HSSALPLCPLCPLWLKPGAPFLARLLREKWGFRTLLANRLSGRLPQPGIAGELRRFVGGFPSEVRVAAPEVPVRRGLPVNRPPQIERLDNPARRQLEVRANQVRD